MMADIPRCYCVVTFEADAKPVVDRRSCRLHQDDLDMLKLTKKIIVMLMARAGTWRTEFSMGEQLIVPDDVNVSVYPSPLDGHLILMVSGVIVPLDLERSAEVLVDVSEFRSDPNDALGRTLEMRAALLHGNGVAGAGYAGGNTSSNEDTTHAQTTDVAGEIPAT